MIANKCPEIQRICTGSRMLRTQTKSQVRSQSSRFVSRLAIVLMCGLLAFFIFSGTGGAQPSNQTGISSNQTQTSKGPDKVQVGIYILNIGKFDLSTGLYTIDFYLNLKSDRPYTIDDLEFVNGHIVSVYMLSDDADGKVYRVQVSLSTNVDLRNYPFDEHPLSIKIEDKLKTNNNLTYLYDANYSGIDPEVSIVGWQLDGFTAKATTHMYAIYNETYSQFIFTIDLKRSGAASFFKVFLPSIIILFVALSTLFIRTPQRITVNSSMLLAALLYHWRMNDSLPLLDYPTFADEFMVVTYIVLFMVLLSGVGFTYYWELKNKEKTDRVYRFALIVIPIIALGLYIALFYFLVHGN